MCEYISLDEEALVEMKSAGYYKIRFGIETGSDHVAEQMTLGKKHNLKKLRSILNFGKNIGMLFYGTISEEWVFFTEPGGCVESRSYRSGGGRRLPASAY